MRDEAEAVAAAWWAFFKLLLLPISMGAIGAGLTFMFAWPRTAREGLVRMSCSIGASLLAGPVLVIIARSWWPQLFGAAGEVAKLYGLPSDIGLLMLAGPIVFTPSVPAWWIGGGACRWLDRRKEKDLGEMVMDVVHTVHDMRKDI